MQPMPPGNLGSQLDWVSLRVDFFVSPSETLSVALDSPWRRHAWAFAAHVRDREASETAYQHTLVLPRRRHVMRAVLLVGRGAFVDPIGFRIVFKGDQLPIGQGEGNGEIA